MQRRLLGLALAFGLMPVLATARAADAPATAARAGEKVSYHKQIRPLFEAHCIGCHQPAKDRGKYVMTAFASLLAGGATGNPAVVAGKPKESHLLELITPDKGKARMPEGKPPLHESEIAVIRKWIEEGAVNDSPASAGAVVDAAHPPVYTRPPTITALDVSPDGKLVAVAGFHETVLVDFEKGKQVARLVGLSERVQSVKFSPDGKRLAVVGGNPSRLGEVQIWNVETRKLALSRPVGFDTLYGVSWAPDGTKVAFGCADNTVRALDAKTGEQVLQQGSHTDWILGTVFSKDGSHLVSVGRDQTAKLTEVATQRFVDNLTSITPGALKGGLQAVARHPDRDEIATIGADGVPRVYRTVRLTVRVIGDDGNLIRHLPALKGRGFAIAVSKDGKRIAAGSSLDGVGEIGVYGYEFDPTLPEDVKNINQKTVDSRSPTEKKRLEDYHTKDAKLIARTPVPSGAIYTVAFHPNNKEVIAAGADGLVRIVDAATGKVTRSFQPVEVSAPKPVAQTASGSAVVANADFVQDVNPILSRLGCNAGTCHGSAQGKAGFKLSLRGYDPIFDVRALTDDLAGRRVNIASPDDSLMLLKATGVAPHAGGKLIGADDPYYHTLRAWIAAGAKLNVQAPKVAKIELTPKDPILNREGDKQQFKVIATYADGKTRDVTKEAYIETGNGEVAAAAPKGGLLTALRRGEAPVLARYEGAYAAVTLTVMGDRSGFEWKEPPSYGKIDDLVARKWKRLQIEPSGLCSDEEFLRRAYLDLTGLPPTPEAYWSFMADKSDSRLKREMLVDRLIGSPEFVEHWTNKWADLLQVNRKYLGVEGSVAFRKWIQGHVAKNTPYDVFVRDVVTASGSNETNPPASYFKILRDPENTLENTTHLFLAVRFNCNKCHDHPFERWTQDQYYETAAFFAQVGLAADPKSGNRRIGGTAVEDAKPLYEIVSDRKEGDVKHQRTGGVVKATFPYAVGARPQTAPADCNRRQEFAGWLTDSKNPYFAKSYVNRLWGYLFGVGLIEPIDDIRAGNPPSNPELLDYLAEEFVKNKFDARHMIRLLAKSRVYQLSIATNKYNEDDKRNYAHATARRLPAEALLDAVYRVTGSKSQFPGLAPGARAAELPDSGVDLPTGFLSAFGRPARESSCECERSHSLQLGPVMALVNGPTIADAIAQPGNEISKLAASKTDDSKLIAEVFLRILCRPPSDKEIAEVKKAWENIERDHALVGAELAKLERTAGAKRTAQEAMRVATAPFVERELAAYREEIAPRLAKEAADRAANTKKLEADYAAYEGTLGTKYAGKLNEFRTRAPWQVLVPTEAKPGAPKRSQLKLHQDGVVEVVKASGRDAFTLTFDSDLDGISAFRLEVLADPKLPNGGPGRAGDGNFVLTEFVVQEPNGKNPPTKVEVADAHADFEQQEFGVKNAIDGATIADRGWAVYPSFGVTHWATFQLKRPLGDGKTKRFQIVLHQQFGAPNYFLGKFRLSATTHPKAVGVSASAELAAVADTQVKYRTKDQLAAVTKYFAGVDNEARDRRNAIAASRMPPAPDGKLVALEQLLAKYKTVTPEDPVLVQLRSDYDNSKRQIADKRLTGAQDLAWALINTPAFLFNR